MPTRALILWDDVPEPERRVHRDDAFQGCPYAVRLAWWDASRRGGNGYRRCGNALYRTNPTCWNHLPEDPRSFDDVAAGRARGILLRSVGLQCGETLATFRAMTDADIRGLQNVGVKIEAEILKIRDTWTDEQIAALTGLPLRKLRPDPAIPSLPCVEPHGALSWLGG